MSRSKSAKLKFSKKYFSIEEAERLLPKIQKIIDRVVKLNKVLDLLSSIEIEVYDDDHNNLRRVTRMNMQFHKLSYEFYEGIERLEEMGCIVNDYEIGIIEFYHRFEDRVIILCWKLGEKSIMFWHELYESRMERKPILELAGHK